MDFTPTTGLAAPIHTANYRNQPPQPAATNEESVPSALMRHAGNLGDAIRSLDAILNKVRGSRPEAVSPQGTPVEPSLIYIVSELSRADDLLLDRIRELGNRLGL